MENVSADYSQYGVFGYRVTGSEIQRFNGTIARGAERSFPFSSLPE
jgi:hypothetical protein